MDKILGEKRKKVHLLVRDTQCYVNKMKTNRLSLIKKAL